VVGEIGTANMRADKMDQLNGRLRDLKLLVEEEVRAHIHQSTGEPVQWHGMTWRAANYHPEEGPVVIAVDEDRMISTAPTFEPKVDGLYLYDLLRYQRHRLPIGNPVAVPRFTPETEEELKEAWRRFQQPAGAQPSPHDSRPSPHQPGWLEGWPALRKALLALAIAAGIAVVVVGAMAFIIASFGLGTAAAGLAIAGFAALLATGLSTSARANPGVPQM
jgi:hypothetical protein